MYNNINNFLWHQRYATERLDCENNGRYVGHIVANNRNGENDVCKISYGFYGYVESYKRTSNYKQFWTIWWPQRDNEGYFTSTLLTDNRCYLDVNSAKATLEVVLKGM